MKNYHDCARIQLGFSDIAEIIIRGLDTTENRDVILDRLKFGGDGSYAAYIIIDGEAEVPSHYTKLNDYAAWIEIFDDNMKRVLIYAKSISVYRAGDYGCLITADGNVRVDI